MYAAACVYNITSQSERMPEIFAEERGHNLHLENLKHILKFGVDPEVMAKKRYLTLPKVTIVNNHNMHGDGFKSNCNNFQTCISLRGRILTSTTSLDQNEPGNNNNEVRTGIVPSNFPDEFDPLYLYACTKCRFYCFIVCGPISDGS